MLSKLVSNTTKSFTTTSSASFGAQPKRVAITGAAGNIGYALVFRIASGQMLGSNQPVILQLIDLPQMKDSLNGVAMELNDCAFPLLAGVECHDSLGKGFKNTDYALLVGAKPRGPGMERGDLLKDNGKIFVDTGKALNDNASRDCKTIVVGNPANTNCLIAAHYAKDIPKENFTAMTRLDHNRAIYQLAEKTGAHVNEIKNFGIFGNHSPTMVPCINSTTIKGKPANDQIDRSWLDSYFNPKVQKRGAEIIAARKLSSAASAANAAIEHIRDWVQGTQNWTSMAVASDGSYNVPKGLIYSFPVTTSNGKYTIQKDVKIDEYYQKALDKTTKELQEERSAVEHLLK